VISGVRRTAVAFVLVTAAVALPSLAWYVVGSRELDREADRAETGARADAQAGARKLAASLAARLEGLRQSESRRPFYHYRNLYHDPKGAYDGPSIIPSPLADGPLDPLVWAHFEVGPDGRYGMPTLNPEVPELSAGESSVRQRAILEAIAACAETCRLAGGEPATVAPRDDAGGIEPASLGPVGEGDGRSGWKRLVIDEAAWVQNVNAGALFIDLMGWEGDRSGPIKERAVAARGSGKITVDVGPFQWKTVPIGGKPALVALREVRTPLGSSSQGFVIDAGRVAEWLVRSGTEARFVTAGSSGVLEAVLPIHGTEWAVAVDAEPPVEVARCESTAAIAEFRTRFGLAVAAAWAVGLAVVGLVWQTERTAQQRSRFAASAAHELRTPLAGLRMYAEMLAEGLGDPARAGDYARRIAGESERLGRVVSNVLGFTRLERGMLRVTAEPADVAAALLECIRGQRRTLEAAGVTVRTDFPAGMPAARFDRDALAHVIQNLLDNAEKYTRGAGDRTVTVGLERGDRGVRVVVADRGPGVAPADRARLFRAFERGRRADAPAGIGLGLVLSRALARAMGGDLVYEDRPGGGSRFVLALRA